MAPGFVEVNTGPGDDGSVFDSALSGPDRDFRLDQVIPGWAEGPFS
ncbi:MAG: hypothetical protein CM15mP25_5280 [Gammaproteobacteria bacterium]|nr:MAG: hypothetical protein CM15mP25_5280 [Gammaproteobacteria bacterium]